MLCLTSCYVDASQWAWAEDKCNERGGLVRVKVDAEIIICECLDGYKEKKLN